MPKLLLFNKPFQVMSQFSGDDGRATLADFIKMPAVYPAGRLDYDSEGLMLLTDDGQWQARISSPEFKTPKVYWAQVEGDIDPASLARLRAGIELKDGPARAISADKIAEPDLWPRTPPIRERKHIPTSWLALSIDEGRNRQVRRMTAAIGFPTLRLVRASIGDWSLGELQPGEYRLEELPALPGAPKDRSHQNKTARGKPAKRRKKPRA